MAKCISLGTRHLDAFMLSIQADDICTENRKWLLCGLVQKTGRRTGVRRLENKPLSPDRNQSHRECRAVH